MNTFDAKSIRMGAIIGQVIGTPVCCCATLVPQPTLAG
jgi:hypothetical protein